VTEDRSLVAQKIIGRVFHCFLWHCAVEIARAKKSNRECCPTFLDGHFRLILTVDATT
jgi:hypothetical protein